MSRLSFRGSGPGTTFAMAGTGEKLPSLVETRNKRVARSRWRTTRIGSAGPLLMLGPMTPGPFAMLRLLARTYADRVFSSLFFYIGFYVFSCTFHFPLYYFFNLVRQTTAFVYFDKPTGVVRGFARRQRGLGPGRRQLLVAWVATDYLVFYLFNLFQIFPICVVG